MTDEETPDDSKKLLEMEEGNKEKELENKENYINKNVENKGDKSVLIELKYGITNYTDKKRLRDDDEITLQNNQTKLIYESGLDEKKQVLSDKKTEIWV